MRFPITKKRVLVIISLISTCNIIAKVNEPIDIKYRRSSLHTIIIETKEFPKKDIVLKAYNNWPFPEKYNDHRIKDNYFNPNDYLLSTEEEDSLGLKKEGYVKNLLKLYADESTGGILDSLDATMPLIIEKYLRKEQIAKKLVSKWFNRSPDGSFNMDLIAERGYYNASEMEAYVAKGSVRGMSSIADAGLELIANTFVVFTKLTYVDNEFSGAIIRDQAKSAAASLGNPLLQLAASKAADIAYNKTKEGYSVWTTSYLYQLEWNDSIETIYYTDYWINKGESDTLRKRLFDETDLFRLKYIGKQHDRNLIVTLPKSERTEEETIEIVTIRNIDKVFSKLQKQYEVFMPKTPLFTGDPITAKIGMKEGLEGGEKFSVLEQIQNPKTGLTEYSNVGTIKVNNKLIWDNRYNMGSEETSDNKLTKSIDRTTFIGDKNKYFEGMLIKQIK